MRYAMTGMLTVVLGLCLGYMLAWMIWSPTVATSPEQEKRDRELFVLPEQLR